MFFVCLFVLFCFFFAVFFCFFFALNNLYMAKFSRSENYSTEFYFMILLIYYITNVSFTDFFFFPQIFWH